MCRVCKEMHGKTPAEALTMVRDMGLPSGRGTDTRRARLARHAEQKRALRRAHQRGHLAAAPSLSEADAHLPHQKNVEKILQRLLRMGVEKVDFLSGADQ